MQQCRMPYALPETHEWITKNIYCKLDPTTVHIIRQQKKKNKQTHTESTNHNKQR